MEILALIPARKNSKRIPNKNMKLLNGTPLIEYTINQSLGSLYINKVIVSSDDNRVKEIVNKYRNNKAFDISFERRPHKLRGDEVTMEQLIEHIRRKHKYGILVVLQPTSPLRTAEDIDKGINLLLFSSFDSVASVKLLEPFHTFIPNGAVYAIKNTKERYNNNMGLFSMPPERSIDIDSPMDFILAEQLIKEKNK